MTKFIAAALMAGGALVAGHGGHGKHGGGRQVYAFDASSSSSSGYGGYGSYASFASSSSSSGGYSTGGYGIAPLASSSSTSSFGGYVGYSKGHKKHGPPGLLKHHKHGHKQHRQEYVIAAPRVYHYNTPKAQVAQFVSKSKPMYKAREVNKVQRKKKIEVTHHPVYHKTVINHKTVHDVEKKDVYHHIGQEENRFQDVQGKTTQAARENIDHGKVGHGAYKTIVGKYQAGSGN